MSATTGGVVTTGYKDDYGHYVDVRNGSLTTRYAHLSSVNVTTGQEVKAGDKLGGVGKSGSATGNHLHFETRVVGKGGDKPTDPQQVFGHSGLSCFTPKK